MRKVIDEINNKTDIVALVSSYVKLERRGKTILVYVLFMMIVIRVCQ